MSEAPDALGSAWAHIGRATTNFEQIEFKLAQIYWILCETQSRAAYECYGTILSFQKKTDFLRIATNNYFRRKSKLKTETLEIIKKAENMAKRRNDMVHAGMPHQAQAYNNPIFYPLEHQSRKWKEGSPKYAMSEWDVIDSSNEILLFVYEVTGFYDELLAFDRKRRAQHARRLNQQTPQ